MADTTYTDEDLARAISALKASDQWSDGSWVSERGYKIELPRLLATIEALLSKVSEMKEALNGMDNLVIEAQNTLTLYLIPDPDGYDADETVGRLVGLFDGPKQRDVQGRAKAALLSKTEGTDV